MTTSTTLDLTIPTILATAYYAAPVNWLRSCGRINNHVRTVVHEGAKEGLRALEAYRLAHPRSQWEVDDWEAYEALLAMKRCAEGTDPRGGPEREQMVTAMASLARSLARVVISEHARVQA